MVVHFHFLEWIFFEKIEYMKINHQARVVISLIGKSCFFAVSTITSLFRTTKIFPQTEEN